VSCWTLPCGAAPGAALLQWTPQLKDATYAALRTLGNACRQVKVRAFLSEQREQAPGAQGRRLKTWAASIGFSMMQPYWHLDNVKAARALLRMRFDMCPTEDFVRSRPSGEASKQLARLSNPGDRACYNCDDNVVGVKGVFWCEDQSHVLCDCSNPLLKALRRRFRDALERILGDDRAVALAVAAGCGGHLPDLDNHSAMLTFMRMCISVGNPSVLAAVPVAPPPPLALLLHGTRAAMAANATLRAAAARARIDVPRHGYDHAAAAHAAAWGRALTMQWCGILREPRRVESPAQSPGGLLAALVASHSQRVFDTRAALVLLRQSGRVDKFCRRERDPPAEVAALVRLRAAVHVDAGHGVGGVVPAAAHTCI